MCCYLGRTDDLHLAPTCLTNMHVGYLLPCALACRLLPRQPRSRPSLQSCGRASLPTSRLPWVCGMAVCRLYCTAQCALACVLLLKANPGSCLLKHGNHQ